MAFSAVLVTCVASGEMTDPRVVWELPEKGLSLYRVNGLEAAKYASEITTLRAALFCPFPYLYRTDPETKKEDLELYFTSAQSFFCCFGPVPIWWGFRTAPLAAEAARCESLWGMLA